MLRLHKGYSIPSSTSITKKLTQQYVGPFRVFEKVDRPAYKLNIPLDQKIYPVFSVAQLEPAPLPANDLFYYSRPHMPPTVFVDGDIDVIKSFEVDRLLNKQIVKKDKGHAVEYLVRWTGYRPEWDRQYNVKDFDNAAELVHDYKKALA